MIDNNSNSVSSDLEIRACTEFENQLSIFNSKAESLKDFFRSKLQHTSRIHNEFKAGSKLITPNNTPDSIEPVLSTIQEIEAFKKAELKRLDLDYIPEVLAEKEVI